VATAKSELGVNVHDGPGPVPQFTVIGIMKHKEKGAVLAKHPDGWCKLELGNIPGGSGWVPEDHLELSNNGNCRP